MKEKFDDNEMDSLFNEKLGKEEIAPREIVWTRIGHELGGGGKKRPVAWIWWLSGIALLLTVGTWFGISAYQEKKLAESKTEIKAENPPNGGFEPVPYDDDGQDGGVIKIKGGTYTAGNSDSLQNKTVSVPVTQNETNTGKKNSAGNSNSSAHNEKNNSLSEDHSTVKQNDHSKKHNPLPSGNSSVSSSGNSSGSLADNPQIPSKEKSASPTDHPVTKSDSVVVTKPVTYFDTATRIVIDLHAGFNDTLHTIAKSDSVPPKSDSVPAKPFLPAYTFPVFFIGMHGGIDAGKILKAEYSAPENSPTEVKVYNTDKIKSIPQQTYAFGVRFGKFVTQRISVNLGAGYSIFETDGNEGNFKYNHNNQLVFKMNTATSSVNCSSANFDYHDSNILQNDTFYISVKSKEKYDYLNLQLGVSFYAIRTKHFGVYGTVYSNQALLMKKNMVITVPKSGKEIVWSGNKLSGMNSLVMAGQGGAGVEWLPFGSFGLWIEPSFYFSAGINKKNSVQLHPGGMRYLAGISYHF